MCEPLDVLVFLHACPLGSVSPLVLPPLHDPFLAGVVACWRVVVQCVCASCMWVAFLIVKPYSVTLLCVLSFSLGRQDHEHDQDVTSCVIQ